MLKPLTLSLGLAVALGTCNLGVAGLHDKPSPQGVMPSEQVIPSEQGGGCDLGGPVKKHRSLFDLFKHKPKCYTYEWVLKKKRVRHGLLGGDCGGCGGEGIGCDSCGETIFPSGQGPSPQGGEWAAPQAGDYGAPQYLNTSQTLGAGQAAPAGQIVPETQLTPAPAAVAAPADPATVPPPAPRDAAPAAPEAPAPPAAPEAPAPPPAPTADAGGLLYLSPAGN